jgi:hypothetical protein
MTEIMWVRSHVERVLQDEWGACRVAADDDGDYPFRRGTAVGWVSVLEGTDAPMVRVWAHAATRLKPTAALLRELNEIQGRCLSASVQWMNGLVIVSQTISAIGLTQPVLAQALNAVGGVADDIGLLLAGMFNGSTPYPAEQPEPEEAA